MSNHDALKIVSDRHAAEARQLRERIESLTVERNNLERLVRNAESTAAICNENDSEYERMYRETKARLVRALFALHEAFDGYVLPRALACGHLHAGECNGACSLCERIRTILADAPNAAVWRAQKRERAELITKVRTLREWIGNEGQPRVAIEQARKLVDEFLAKLEGGTP